MSFWSRRQQMGWAAALLGGSVLLSRFMGLARDKVISYFFGASLESDVYFAAFVIPDFINYLLAGGYFSITLIPLLAEKFSRDEEDAWRFFSSVLVWVAAAITSVTAAAMVWAPELSRWAAPGLEGPALERLALFLRIILPAQVFFLLGACFSAVCYLRKQFHVPALSPLIYNGAIIVGGIWMRRSGMEGFCWGVLAGAFLGNFLLPCLAVRFGGGLRLHWTPRHPSLKRFFLLALPLMVGQSVVVLDEQFIRIFGSMAETGAISWLNYARRIMFVPVGVVAQAAGVASYPFLADLFARGDRDRFFQTLNSALRNTLVVLVPVSAWMMLAAGPTITLIFQQGRFSAADTAQTAWALRVFLAVVFCWGFQQILGRGYYARQDTVTPAVVGTLATAAAVPLYLMGSRLWGAKGVALASAASLVAYTTLLSAWWRIRLGPDAFRGLARSGLRVGLVTAAALIPAALGHYAPMGWHVPNPYLGALVQLGLSGLLFSAAFLILARRTLPDLLDPFLRKLQRKR
ncbi:murein biosynthesis integral membrane protein MurJ [Desulfacinum hydrothermale]|nr:murein biosynthesis integral membrane protein MurJ [Desulfacinum hydrothermale]